MLKRTSAIASTVILLWYVVGAVSGWKGWVPPPSAGGGGMHASPTRGTSGGHGSISPGGWGGGK